MSSKLSRRTFILSIAAAGLSATFGGWWIFNAKGTDSLGVISGILKKHLPYLTLEESGVMAFSKDFFQTRPGPIDHLAKWDWVLGPINSVFNIFDDSLYKKRVHKLEERIVRQYLMSSDFFFHNADEKRTIQYLGYYNPYSRACANPFAKFSES